MASSDTGIRTLEEIVADLPRPFVAEVDEGIGAAIDQLADADNGAQAVTITIKLVAKRAPKGQIEIAPTHTIATKRAPHVSSVYYVNAKGSLVNDDPRQVKLGFDDKGRPRLINNKGDAS